MLDLTHYYYILQKHGVKNQNTSQRLREIRGYALERVKKTRDHQEQRKGSAELYVTEQHNLAWNMAEYYYEKASKTLCQMMITVMDYILQAKTGTSVLYESIDRISYFDLLDEIETLNKTYISCFNFLSVYDYCTEQIATFTGINEYKTLDKEHERIIENGMPARVSSAIEALIRTSEGRDHDGFTNLEKAFSSNPGYYEQRLAKCFKMAVKDHKDEIIAMRNFSGFVIRMDEYYEADESL